MKNGKYNYNEIIFDNHQVQHIIDSYNSGKTSVEIGREYGISHKPILKILHKNGVDVNAYKNAYKKYQVDESYFDSINNQNKAYILGFLYADGYSGISKGTLTMALQEDDFEILEKIRLEIGSTKPLEYLDYSKKHDFGYNYKNQYRLNVFSKHMCETLQDYGMVPNKSLSLEFPSIPNEYYSHFIRGYFDGDGSINKVSGGFGIVSTRQFCISISEIILSETGVYNYKINESGKHNGITCDLRYNKKSDSKILFDWIYKDANLYMKRKYNKYREIHYFNVA